MKKIYNIYFLLGLFITAFYSCGEDLTPVGPDIAEITHFRNDGPYLFYKDTNGHYNDHPERHNKRLRQHLIKYSADLICKIGRAHV